jgi:hypothetical protein
MTATVKGDFAMSKASRCFTLVASFVVLVAVAVPKAAEAQTVPIRLGYEGTFTPPTVVSLQPLVVFTTDQLAGEGSHLGRFTAQYPHEVNFDAGTFSGTATFTAANGDLLWMQLGGTGFPISATTFAVNFVGTITGGTGRFEGASGSVTGTGRVDLAALGVKATLEGTINKDDLPFAE